MPSPTVPTLELVDSEIAEVVRFFGLTVQQSLAGSPSRAAPASDGGTVSFREAVGTLKEGLPREGTNRTLFEAVSKSRDYLLFLEETWKVMSDTSGFEPKFDEIVSEEQLNSVLEFIDQDRNGTLELNELLDAFRVSKR
jgi:Ca2+-binding EF-hand superfamily protein